MRTNITIAIAGVTVGLAVLPASAKSPGRETFGNLTIGPGGPGTGNTLALNFQINDAGPSPSFPSARGVAGPLADANNNVSGWSLLYDTQLNWEFGTGDLTWSATSTPGSQFHMSLETLLGPTTPVGQSPDGVMASFDPNLKYVWPFIIWDGTYTGPTADATLTADTVIDTSPVCKRLQRDIRHTFRRNE